MVLKAKPAARAGIVKDPADYRGSGYAGAVAGRKPARLGPKKVVMGVLGSDWLGGCRQSVHR
jgi:hypothetical protein